MVDAGLIRLLRRVLHDPILVNVVSLATPFAAYLLGQSIDASAFLAVAITGLLVGHATPRVTSGHSRLQIRAVWRLVDFGLQSFVFLLIGQQLPAVVRHLGGYSIGTVATAVGATLGAVLLIRPVYVFLSQWVPQRLLRREHERASLRYAARLSGREVVALSWAATRGVVTLTTVLTLPYLTASGHAFPDRSLLIFCGYLSSSSRWSGKASRSRR